MSFFNDHMLDLALSYIDTATTRLDICSAEPATFAQATSTFSLGNKTGISVGAPADRSPTGRQVTIAAVTDGTVTANGTAAWWALSDTVNSRLIAAQTIATPKAVVTGSPWTIDAITIGIPDPA